MLRSIQTRGLPALRCVPSHHLTPSTSQVKTCAVPMTPTRALSLTPTLSATAAWKKMLVHHPAYQESDVAEGEKYFWLDRSMLSNRFPTLETMTEPFDGVAYQDLPIINLRVTKNNTIISVRRLDDKRTVPVCCTSAGVEGFKNCRKGTAVAAQSVGVSIGLKMKRRGIKTARLCIKGFGPGRMAAVEGMVMAGVDIVSVSDITPLPEYGPRPRKARRV